MSTRRVLTRTGNEVHLAEDVVFVRAEWSLTFDLCRIVGREDYDEVENRVRALVADLIAEKVPR